MTSDSNDVIYEMWLSGEIAAGRVKAPGWNNPILRRAWLKATWIGSSMPDIDQLRTAKGVKEYLKMQATTGERTSLEHNGSSFNDNLEKNKVSFAEMPVLPDTFPPSSGSGDK
jgi:capsid protein